MEFNLYLSTVEELNLDNYPDEILEQFWDFINNSPYINYFVGTKRKYAKDLPRDDKGRIIVDIVHPHYLENMDYFRPSALHYKKHKCYTLLRPNPNPNSEYGKWVREEVRRCHEGYVRESDGEWVTGLCYWFLNYSPMALTKSKKGSKKGERVIDFPEVWEGIYYRYHYIDLAINGGLYSIKKINGIGGDNGCEISSRIKGKSFTMASIMSKYFILGESKTVNREVKSMATAYLKLFLTSDGILNKFLSYIDFLAENTEFPKRRLKSSLLDMAWRMGYVDLDTMTLKGTLNEVMGVSTKDDYSKVRGKRLNFIVCEEFGSFKHIVELYNIMLPSILEGGISFGFCYLIGTAGDSQSDFTEAQEIIYNPDGYLMYGLPNDFDISGLGRAKTTFFFPGYLNRKGCYDENGNSDITKAILEILDNRYRVKYNSLDINTITKTIAEIPITPLEAVFKTRGSIFPTTQLTERKNLLLNNPNEFDEVYCGGLALEKDGKVKFIPSNETPIREYPLKDISLTGCLEIYQMPEYGSNGKINPLRYICSSDPADNDSAESVSLVSHFVMDLFTDKVVAEFTGRYLFADLNYEVLRLLCMFYNCKCLYENNKKGTFAYFSKMNCTHLLADTPLYLKDKLLIKTAGYGSSLKGVNATAAINGYADLLIKDWLLKPVTIIQKVQEDDKEVEREVTIPLLYLLRNLALIEELILYNPYGNFDRIRSFGMLMLYREELMITFNGNIETAKSSRDDSYAGNDKFFTDNYDNRF